MADEADLIAAVEAIGPATTREVADLVGCSERAAEYRLRKLCAEGAVDFESVGASFVWRPVVELDDRIDARSE